jgi:hypothetical protein
MVEERPQRIEKVLESKDASREDIEGDEADCWRPSAKSIEARVAARTSPVTM